MGIRRAAAALALTLTIALSAGGASASPRDEMLSGDTRDMIAAVLARYADAGLSFNDRIVWQVESFTTIVSYYDHNERIISVGAVPNPGQVKAYWQNWSRALTDGRWSPDDFFQSPDEAEQLARFNQFLIYAHEAGHAFAFRYDYDHNSRHKYDINCREYHADRLSDALVLDMARQDPAIGALKERYVALIAAVDAGIAPEFRYTIPDVTTLEDNCAVISVAQPTEETMQPYASAFFERQRLLLTDDRPPLSAAARAYLIEPHLLNSRGRLVTRLDSRHLTTRERLKGVRIGYSGDVTTAAGFDPAGQVYRAELDYNEDTQKMTLRYGAGDAPFDIVLKDFAHKRAVRSLDLTSVLPVSADRFLAIVEEDRNPPGALLLDAVRRDDKWVVRVARDLDGIAKARLARDAVGGVHLLSTPKDSLFDNTQWTRARFDPDSYDVGTPEALTRMPYPPAGIDADGSVYVDTFNQFAYVQPNGTAAAVAGNLLEGSKDGPATGRAEILDIVVAQPMADGSLLILDDAPEPEDTLVRVLGPDRAGPKLRGKTPRL